MNLHKHYLELKKQNPDALVFYRVGDFYELFGADAIVASKALDLTLTSRDVGAERVPMCGVPYHSIESHVAKLIENGCKVALCEPSTQIPQAENEPIKSQGRLNLTASGTEQTILKEYLEANASDILVEKINNDVKIVKDGKTLISKKTLETFLVYACEEARKLAEKVSKTPGARAACIEDKTVFGWLIHYFEEDSIEGVLYNEDGSEYKPPKPISKTNTAKPPTTATAVIPSKEKPKTQFSLFDMLDNQAQLKTELDETDTDEPLDEPEDETDMKIESDVLIAEIKWADEDGVIYEVTETKKDIIPDSLTKLFGDLVIAR